MQRHTPAPLLSDSLAPKLAPLQRILDYAYGAQGDKIILDNHIGRPDVEKANKEAEIIEYYSKHSLQSSNLKITNKVSHKI